MTLRCSPDIGFKLIALALWSRGRLLNLYVWTRKKHFVSLKPEYCKLGLQLNGLDLLCFHRVSWHNEVRGGGAYLTLFHRVAIQHSSRWRHCVSQNTRAGANHCTKGFSILAVFSANAGRSRVHPDASADPVVVSPALRRWPSETTTSTTSS